MNPSIETNVSLAEREERLRQTVAALRAAVWLVDSQTQQVLYVNPAFETICGCTRDDFCRGAMVLSQLIHPDDRARVQPAGVNSASMVSCNERFRIIRPDGSVRWVESRAAAVKNEAGENCRLVSILEDVTPQVEVEELQRRRDEQLHQAQKLEAIGTMAGGLAHDFNNVLAGILGSVELARTELPSDHPAQQFLESIVFSSNRGRDLIRQVHAFSRRKNGEKSLVPLQPVVAECVKLLRSTIPATVRITWRAENSCAPVLADPMEIHQVIMNLGMNAWQALPTADGQIEITLQTAAISEAEAKRYAGLTAGPYVCLTVRDNGQGMDAATQQKIFDPFFTTKRSSKAVGLGLSIAYSIVKAHQGAITVQSVPGSGATFSVYLPAHAAAAEAVQPRQLSQGRGERILLVDDEQTLAVVTEKALTRSGFSVMRFDRAERALERFRETPDQFDLVITDFAMPGMSGTDLAKALLLVRADLPILLVSGFVDESVRVAAEAIGVREVLLKPLAIENLREAINRALAGVKNPPPS
jgi:PAS domain S-box-containing protein